jgi:Replication-relaxation
LQQWLPEAACQSSGTFTHPDDPALIRAYQPRVRPDGYGLWADTGRQVPFFLEYDTGTEQLSILAGKIAGYHELFRTIGRAWPVLFCLHSAARERNLRTRLADLPTVIPVATGARDHATSLGLSPAGNVWTINAGEERVPLADLTIDIP